MLRCALLDDYQKVALASADWSRLSGRVEIRAFHEHIADRAALARALAGYEIIVAMRERTPFDRALLEALPALRLLVTTGHRNAAIDVAAATERGITVCSTRGFPGPAAELTWALILALMRNLPREVDAFHHGAWQTTVGRSLHGAKLGVVGMGNLGTQVAAVGRAFGMQVIGWSRSLTPARCAELGVEYAATLPELLRVADVVRASLPDARQRGGDAAHRLRHARELRGVLWRCGRRHRGVARRASGACPLGRCAVNRIDLDGRRVRSLRRPRDLLMTLPAARTWTANPRALARRNGADRRQP